MSRARPPTRTRPRRRAWTMPPRRRQASVTMPLLPSSWSALRSSPSIRPANRCSCGRSEPRRSSSCPGTSRRRRRSPGAWSRGFHRASLEHGPGGLSNRARSVRACRMKRDWASLPWRSRTPTADDATSAQLHVEMAEILRRAWVTSSSRSAIFIRRSSSPSAPARPPSKPWRSGTSDCSDACSVETRPTRRVAVSRYGTSQSARPSPTRHACRSPRCASTPPSSPKRRGCIGRRSRWPSSAASRPWR